MGRTISNAFIENESDVDVVCVYFAHTTQHSAIKEKKILAKLRKFMSCNTLLHTFGKLKII